MGVVQALSQPPMLVEGSGIGYERPGGDKPVDVYMNEGDLDDDFIEGCYSLKRLFSNSL